MKNKKGNAMIYVIFTVLILIFLGGMLLFNGISSYKITINNEKRDKLYLVSESGIEKGIVLLKQKIVNSYEIFEDHTIALICPNLLFTEENFGCVVSFEDIENFEGKGYCVAVTSTAIDKVNGRRKTLKEYILKNEISNKFYDYAFSNVLTCLDNTDKTNKNSFIIGDNVSNLTIDGNMYLQGDNIALKPNSDILKYTRGNIAVNSNYLHTVDDKKINSVMKIKSSCITDPKELSDNVEKTNAGYIEILPIKRQSLNESELKDFYEDPGYVNQNPKHKIFSSKILSKNKDGSEETTLVVFKILKINESENSTFNMNEMIKDVKNYIMRNMIVYRTETRWKAWVDNGYVNNNIEYGKKMQEDYSEEYKDGYYYYKFKGAYSLVSYDVTFEKLYEGMYKVYLIDGDANMENPVYAVSFINHIIYSTGKFDIKPTINNKFAFQNGSITAKRIEVGPLSNVFFQGVTPLNKSLTDSSYKLSPFSIQNRGKINKFFIQNLYGYADAITFKIYKVEEK